MWNFVAPILVLLPQRWRAKWFAHAYVNWPRAALLSGFLEGAGCLLALIGWYLYYIQIAVDQQAGLTAQALLTKDPPKGATGAGLSYAMGLSALAGFAMHPLTWALAYFTIEGVLRTFAAYSTEEAPGTLPLVLLDRAIVGGKRRAYEKRVPLVADVVTRGGEKDPWDLKIESCREKPAWKYPLTISLEGEFFQVVGGAQGGGVGRPHVYLLRRPPPGEAFRGVQPYCPEDILRAVEKPPHFLAAPFAAVSEKWRLRQLPLVEDIVSHGDGSKGWHLMVESCRPKPMWAPPRTIRFEDVLYKVVAAYESKPPRPFGYRLVFLPPNEAARGVLDYSPDEPLREREE